MTEFISQSISRPLVAPYGMERPSLPFYCSAFLFRLGLALLTFEQVRPAFDIQISDYFFFLSLLLLVYQPGVFSLGTDQKKILIPGLLILVASLVSLVNSSSLTGVVALLARFVVLFGLFAPLSIIHAKNLRKNMLFVLAGIFANCVVTILQGTIFPGIANVLSINPTKPDISDIGRFQGLTSHPNIIGLSAGLAILIGLGLLSFEEYKHLRGRMVVVVVTCCIAALFSGSRAVFVALLPGLFILAIAQRQRRQMIVRMVLAVVIVWGATTYIAPAAISQFSSRLDSSGADLSSDYGRLMSAVYTVAEISQKPILGWGMDHFNEAGLTEVPWTGEIVGVHNTFLKYWHGAGIVGAIGFVALFAVPVRIMWKRMKKSSSQKVVHILALSLGCTVYLFVVSNLGPFDYNRFLYIPLFIFGGFATRSFVSRAQFAQQTPPTRPGAFDGSLGPKRV
jgi:O-antigen ligase